MTSGIIEAALNILSCGASLGSAYFWIRAARVKIPRPVRDSDRGDGPFADAKFMQSQMNAKAALLAGVTALMQAGTVALHFFGHPH